MRYEKETQKSKKMKLDTSGENSKNGTLYVIED